MTMLKMDVLNTNLPQPGGCWVNRGLSVWGVIVNAASWDCYS